MSWQGCVNKLLPFRSCQARRSTEFIETNFPKVKTNLSILSNILKFILFYWDFCLTCDDRQYILLIDS